MTPQENDPRALGPALHPRPKSKADLFFSFSMLALQGFGGVLAIVQRELVEKKQWLTQDEFLEDWAVAQILPGPNVVNLSLMIGDRYFGFGGALAALAGMLAFPLVIVLAMAIAFGGVADTAAAQGALRGMGAVAAGLIAATGVKLISALKRNVMGLAVCWVLAVLSFIAIALLRLPLVWVLLGVGGVACFWAYRQLEEAKSYRGIAMTTIFTGADWLALLLHFMSLSLLAIGGAITTVPEMHNYLVGEKIWLTDSQFTSSIALAQAAPGPNVLFVALVGWNVGLNAGGGVGAGWHAWWSALAGVLVAMVGIMLPSTTLTFLAARWGHQNRELRAVRAFKQGMAPIVIALLIATGWILAASHGDPLEHWRLWLVTAVTALVVWRTRLHMLWLLGAGAALGAFGLV